MLMSAWGLCPFLSQLPSPALPSRFALHREKHFHYLKRGLRQLTEAYEVLLLVAVPPLCLPEASI